MSYKLTATVFIPIRDGDDLDNWHGTIEQLQARGAKVEIDGIDFVEDKPPDVT